MACFSLLSNIVTVHYLLRIRAGNFVDKYLIFSLHLCKWTLAVRIILFYAFSKIRNKILWFRLLLIIMFSLKQVVIPYPVFNALFLYGLSMFLLKVLKVIKYHKHSLTITFWFCSYFPHFYLSYFSTCFSFQ